MGDVKTAKPILIYDYEIFWKTAEKSGTLDYNVKATSEIKAMNKSLKLLPGKIIEIQATRIR